MKRYIVLIVCLLFTAGTTFCQQVRKSRKGIIVIDDDVQTRAMEPYAGSRDNGAAYANVVNEFKRHYDKANVYCMIIPNAIGIYCPEEARNWSKDEAEAIRMIYAQLSPKVHSIEIIDTLRNHRNEEIYLRTDHHWSPLGAYYAARTFASSADVPFNDLTSYEPNIVHNFVGTMYKFTRESCIAKHPEDFIYYKPKNVSYETTQVNYRYKTLRKRRKRVTVLTATPPRETDFFRYYADGSVAAYSTFMGGDYNTTAVRTSTANKRRLLILKDSYGNALPPFLFGSFEEIHVVDCRYFIGNIIKYSKANNITDVLFANNLIHASAPVTSQTYKRYMTQSK